MRCVLTITVMTPQGPSRRSYTSEPGFKNRTDAKGEAALVAVNMGALDFIQSAMLSIHPTRQRHEVRASSGGRVERDDVARSLNQLCLEWRPGGHVRPEYWHYQHRESPNREPLFSINALYRHAYSL